MGVEIGYPDLWYDMITPETGGIRLDADQRILMRCLARFQSTMGVFSRGYGKCVTGDTLLFTEQGIKEIGEFFNYQQDDKETYYSHNIRLLNRYGELEVSDKGVYSGYKQTKKITTEEGYEIETTLVHPLLVMNKNGKLEWKKAKDIQIGDYLPISKNNDVWGNKTKLNIDMDTWLESFNNDSCWKIERNKCNIIDELDEGLALIMGYLVGDGCLTRPNTILFTNKDEDILFNFITFMEERLGVKVVKKNDMDYLIYGMYVREYFNQLGLKQVSSYDKEIPKIILEAPKNIVASFIRGLFDTDGGLADSYIEFCTASEKMSKQLQVLLLNFGIVSTRTKKYNKQFNTYSYRICIYGKNMDIFLNEIGFSCKRKQQRLIKLCLKRRNSNKDIIPYQHSLLNQCYTQAKIHNKGLWRLFGNTLSSENQLTYERFEKILDIENNEECLGYDELLEIYNTYYFYSKVKSVDDSENHVYDLQVPDTHSFIANGFVSHNTMIELMGNYHACVFYPDIEIAMTAQTKENASNLIGEKYREISRFYPLINYEIDDEPRIAKDKATVKFKSGAILDTLANQQSSKGARRKRLTVEESAQVSFKMFEDVLEPVVNIPRKTIGRLAVVNPHELNGQINRFTTSWYRGTDEYEASLRMVDEMVELKGNMVLGAGWELPCEFGRGELKSQILDKKEKLSPTFFALNYESKWVGVADGALVPIKKVMDLRTLTKAELKGVKDGEYILGVDVARSNSTNNNQCSIAVLRIKRNSAGKINAIQLVNMINIPSVLNFKVQAQEVMRIRNLYNAKAVVVDGNGLGRGLIDNLVLEQVDPHTGESLGCWKVMNTEQDSELNDAEEILYDLKAQSNNSEVIVNFIDMIESKKLQLLEKRIDANYDIEDEDYMRNEVLPFMQTDFLLEEIANLKLKTLPSGKFTVEQQTRRIDKDRYSALAYALWYIKEYEDEGAVINTEIDTIDYLLIN